MAAIESATQVRLGGVRGGPDVATLRNDRWWLQPVVTVSILTAFVIYSTWAAFQNKNYYVGANVHRDLISPFYSPCLASSCVEGSRAGFFFNGWSLSPAFLILLFPLGFRLSCYYYRRSYYRAFWWSPPACAVSDAHSSYSGETRFPLVMQNIHRYFFYAGLVLNVILTYDAVIAFRNPEGQWGHMSFGTLVLCFNAVMLWMYSISCHSCRHTVAGRINNFSKHPVRYKLWTVISRLNEHHMRFAWISLIGVAFADYYVYLVASGQLSYWKFF